MRILAVDPGPHIGVAWWANDIFTSMEDNPDNFYSILESWADWAHVIVVESFKINGPRDKTANQTIEIIGAIKYVASRKGVMVVEQAPADSMRFSTREKLERVGWWKRGDSDHARSASKHLLLYMATVGMLREELLP